MTLAATTQNTLSNIEDLANGETMELENLKRWHWLVVSVVLGGLLALSRMYSIDGSRSIPGEGVTDRLSIGAGEFAASLPLKTSKGFPLISDLTIYPPAEGKMFVTGMQLVKVAEGQGKHRPFQITTEIPFKLTGRAAPTDPNYTVRDFIDATARTHAHVTYRFAWWAQPSVSALIWGGGTVLAVGVIWPMLIGLMTGAGMLPKRKAAEQSDEYDLDRFGKYKELHAGAGKAPVSEADRRRLAEVQAAYEKNLAPSGNGKVAAGMPVEAGAGPVKALSAGPLETSAAAQAHADEPKEYTGEYYPVAKTGAGKEHH